MNSYLKLIMENSDIRKLFGSRLKSLRKQREFSQKELAELIGTSYQQLNKYEGGVHSPPFEKLAALAEALNTSIDFLVTGNSREEITVHSPKLLKLFQEIEGFGKSDQTTVMNVIEALIVRRKVEGLVGK